MSALAEGVLWNPPNLFECLYRSKPIRGNKLPLCSGLSVHSDSLLRCRYYDDWCWCWRFWWEKHGRYPSKIVALESSWTTWKEEIHPEGINSCFTRGLVICSDLLLHRRCHHYWCCLWRCCLRWERILYSLSNRLASYISQMARKEEVHTEGINIRFYQVLSVHSESLLRHRWYNKWYWRWCWWWCWCWRLERLLRSPSKRVALESSWTAWK